MSIYLITICGFFAINSVYGREGDVTPTMQIFRQLELCIYEDFIDRGESLPESFESIARLRKILEGHPRMITNLNKFTIVPEAPTIQPAQGLANEFSGNQVYAISRTPDLQTRKVGRFALFTTSNGTSVFPNWIPEPQFQIILKQLKGFDPAKQPLAFQDLAQDSTGKTTTHRTLIYGNDSNRGDQYSTLPAESKTKKASKSQIRSLPLWIAGGAVCLIFVIGYVMHQRRCKSSN